MLMKDKLEKAITENGELAAKVGELSTGIEQLKTNETKAIADATEVKAAFDTAKIEWEKQQKEASEQLQTLSERTKALEQELQKAKLALGNPAFVDAAIVGESKALSAGDSKVEDIQELHGKMKAIQDPKERMSFYRKYILKQG